MSSFAASMSSKFLAGLGRAVVIGWLHGGH
jgi:hypothetical protein